MQFSWAMTFFRQKGAFTAKKCIHLWKQVSFDFVIDLDTSLPFHLSPSNFSEVTLSLSNSQPVVAEGAKRPKASSSTIWRHFKHNTPRCVSASFEFTAISAALLFEHEAVNSAEKERKGMAIEPS